MSEDHAGRWTDEIEPVGGDPVAADRVCEPSTLDDYEPERSTSTDPAHAIIGSSTALRDALRELAPIVESAAPVLILGESGTGKELLARKIHDLGRRASGAFVAQNAAAMPAELVESELFGHAQGAFTGASARAKRGLLELADGGTFFLDEIADLSPALQAKLLRVLEDKQVRRVGETAARTIDFRLICATNHDIRQEVEAGRFRHDLLYRINVFTVTLPPLRVRLSDVPELAQHFATLAAARLARPRPELSTAALEVLRCQLWPGNVRELANVIERAVALARDGVIGPEHLGIEAADTTRRRGGTLRDAVAQVEREHIARALEEHHGNMTAAARELGIARQQLQRLAKKHGLTPR